MTLWPCLKLSPTACCYLSKRRLVLTHDRQDDSAKPVSTSWDDCSSISGRSWNFLLRFNSKCRATLTARPSDRKVQVANVLYLKRQSTKLAISRPVILRSKMSHIFEFFCLIVGVPNMSPCFTTTRNIERFDANVLGRRQIEKIAHVFRGGK
jgi:hypothetical protein